MAYTMRTEDRLDGVSNFNSWKASLLFILEDSDLESHLQNDPPKAGDDASKAKYKKEESRAKRIIIDFNERSFGDSYFQNGISKEDV